MKTRRRNRDTVILGAGLVVLIEAYLMMADHNFWFGVLLFYLGLAGIAYPLKRWLN